MDWFARAALALQGDPGFPPPISMAWLGRELLWWSVVASFGLFGGYVRVLIGWTKDTVWTRAMTGEVLIGCFVALVVGLAGNAHVADKRSLLSLSAVSGFFGREAVALIWRARRKMLGMEGPS